MKENEVQLSNFTGKFYPELSEKLENQLSK